MSNFFDRTGKFQKKYSSGLRLKPRSSGLLYDTLPLRHTSSFIKIKDLANNFIKRRDSCIPNRKFELPYSSLFFLTYLYFVPTTFSSSRYVLALEVKKFKLRKAPYKYSTQMNIH